MVRGMNFEFYSLESHSDMLDRLNEEAGDDRKAFRRLYHEAASKLREKFKMDALAEVGLANHPRRDKAFDLAWDRGHAYGYREVYQNLEELAQLLLD